MSDLPIYSSSNQLNQPQPDMPKKQTPKKYLIGGLLVVFLFATVGLVFLMTRNERPPESSAAVTAPNLKPEDTNIRLVATGDMIPHDALNAAAKDEGIYDYFQFMQNMQPYFEAADIRFCNQAVLGGGEEFGITGYPNFNSPTEFAKDMNKVGCNLINTGTNHTNDFSQAVINSSVSAWDDLDVLAVAGANRSEQERDTIKYFDVDGVNFAFLSYSTYTNAPGETNYGLSLYESGRAKNDIKKAKSQADIVIVSMRWGTEYSENVNPKQKQQAKDLARYGADIVLGHGPHVLQPVEVVKESGNRAVVWYSLGNFLNAQLEAETLFNGFASMSIDKDTKEVSVDGYLPVYMHYDWSPEQKAKEDLLARSNFEMLLLEDAEDKVNQSQLNTTVAKQRARLQTTLNTFQNTPLLTSDQYQSL